MYNNRAYSLSRRDIARHGLGGGSSPPPNKNIAPPNKMKPISSFGLMCVCYILSKKNDLVTEHKMLNIIFDQLKEHAAGVFFCFVKVLAHSSAEIAPPKPKILATSLLSRRFVKKRANGKDGIPHSLLCTDIMLQHVYITMVFNSGYLRAGQTNIRALLNPLSTSGEILDIS